MSESIKNKDISKLTKGDLILELEDLKIKYTELQEEVNALNSEYAFNQLKLACNMVTQKSYAEIAFQFGNKLGKSVGEIKALSIQKEWDVLSNKHNPLHETNTNEFIVHFMEHIKARLDLRKYDFQNEFIPLLLAGKTTVLGDDEFTYWFEAIDYWLKLAKEGNKEAQKNLIVCFNLGYGTEISQDYVEYWVKKLNNEDVQEPNFIGLPEINSNANELEANSIIDSTIQNIETEKQELSNEDKNKIYNSLLPVYEELKKIPTIHIKTHPCIEQLREFDKNTDLPFEIKNELIGAAIALHSSDFQFKVENVKNYGSFFHQDKRGDVSLTIRNNSDWAPMLFISAKDDAGHTYQSKYKINPGVSTINLFSKHPVGTKIISISFETIGDVKQTYFYNPKNVIIE